MLCVIGLDLLIRVFVAFWPFLIQHYAASCTIIKVRRTKRNLHAWDHMAKRNPLLRLFLQVFIHHISIVSSYGPILISLDDRPSYVTCAYLYLYYLSVYTHIHMTLSVSGVFLTSVCLHRYTLLPLQHT